MKLFKRSKLNQKGFSHVEAVLAILVIAGITAVGVRVITGSHAATISKIVYTNGTGIYTVDAQGNNTKVYSSAKTANGGVSYATWANNQSQIYWGFKTQTTSAQIQKAPEIHSMTYDGQQVKNITSLDALPGYTQLTNLWWSESAQKLLFTLETNQTTTTLSSSYVYTMNSDGSGLKQIYTINGSIGYARAAYWSPNGKKVFIGVAGNISPWYGGYMIVVNSDGTNLITLKHDPLDPHGNLSTFASHNPWSSDSSNLVFSDNTNYNNQYVNAVMTEPSDGSKLPQFVSQISPSIRINNINNGPQWSSDGTSIVYCGKIIATTSSSQCYRVRFTAANQISPQTSVVVGSQITLMGSTFDFSPNSSAISYGIYSNNLNPLYKLNLNSGTSTNLNVVNTAPYFEWSIQ
jgi:hypothetical protein